MTAARHIRVINKKNPENASGLLRFQFQKLKRGWLKSMLLAEGNFPKRKHGSLLLSDWHSRLSEGLNQLSRTFVHLPIKRLYSAGQSCSCFPPLLQAPITSTSNGQIAQVSRVNCCTGHRFCELKNEEQSRQYFRQIVGFQKKMRQNDIVLLKD